jgi:hypothetical protein
MGRMLTAAKVVPEDKIVMPTEVVVRVSTLLEVFVNLTQAQSLSTLFAQTHITMHLEHRPLSPKFQDFLQLPGGKAEDCDEFLQSASQGGSLVRRLTSLHDPTSRPTLCPNKAFLHQPYRLVITLTTSDPAITISLKQ